MLSDRPMIGIVVVPRPFGNFVAITDSDRPPVNTIEHQGWLNLDFVPSDSFPIEYSLPRII